MSDESSGKIKIAIIRRNGLGDFICGTVPLVNYLKNKYRDNCEFYFFMGHMNQSLVRYFYPEANVYVIPKGNKYFNTLTVALKYRNLKIDIGISPLPDYPKLNNLFLYLLGAKERYARIASHPCSKNTINHPCTDIGSLVHSNVGLGSIKIFDNNVESLDEKLYPTIRQEMLSEYKTKVPGKCVLTELSNNRETSLLSVEKLADILNHVYVKQPFSLLLTGKRDSKKRAEILMKKIQMPADLYYTQDLGEFLSFVNRADIVLTGDGGLGHISGALGKEVIAMYGQTSMLHWGILSNRVKYLYDAQDINNISNEEIENALLHCLNEGK